MANAETHKDVLSLQVFDLASFEYSIARLDPFSQLDQLEEIEPEYGPLVEVDSE